MIQARDFVHDALGRGYDWYAGVPCSFLTPFINYVIGDGAIGYVSAANEGDAVAIAAGTWIGGHRGIAMMQNSGLGNALNPLTSLLHTFRIPVLLICTHRGAPGVDDEPQHDLMGRVTGPLLDTVHVPWTRFPSDPAEISAVLDEADHRAAERRAYALVLEKGSCAPHPPAPAAAAPRPTPVPVEGRGHVLTAAERGSRQEALEAIVAASDEPRTVVVATTGYTGRELYAIADRPNHLYMVGSMGCASSLGLGLALARPDLRVVVADGDGAALMRMGNLATIGAYLPKNLLHVVLDNEAHDSTGAQATVSSRIDLAGVAAACGYRRVLRTDSATELREFLRTPEQDGPYFAHMKIRTGTRGTLPRPALRPPDVLDRLMDRIGRTP
ncbi:phosphonopyruvate decarboxylase [Streptomyces sp. NPDC048191]|uniref:phosphonopyruvate decarboxylase n=1 Tax=Streptomyces sp. NPDC048191 TaxID=3155484 RepID=UPI0033C1BD12